MFGIATETVIALVSIVLAGFALWDYQKNGRTWTVRAKIWIRTALIFAAVALYLIVE